ncbi:Radical SAM domain protein [Thermodesulfobacterium geofontis OPF15]|uniref:Radical SAM domain protein n=1 Tax=Thermodesulfobacterium geofontis (strain OPF15) TaxID=795359 RepID=F8C4G4_THEGP|nr:radical SAM protein [Thermodesulfobacterium geofontis]AEH22795.1 Radical SAM domain protein [Thermodesulfobacterium geofontis OPF15]
MIEKETLIFGPVKSRRLGRSLGIELVPKKVCTMNCIYCEVGKTTNLTLERKEYYPWDLIERSILQAKEIEDTFDVLTFTGSGEPSLNIHFEKALRLAKKIIKKPVAVLTNATLLDIPSIRSALAEVDIVLPSLDAGNPETFKKINRPHPKIELKTIIENLKKLREEMKGEMWLEILFVEGINDSEKDLKDLKSAIDYINPHKVQLNTVVRPPAFEKAKPLSFEKLKKIAEFLGERVEIIVDKERLEKAVETFKDLEKEKIKEIIFNYLKRRPSTLEELSSALKIEKEVLEDILKIFISQDKVKEKLHEGKKFFIVE